MPPERRDASDLIKQKRLVRALATTREKQGKNVTTTYTPIRNIANNPAYFNKTG